LIQGLFRFELLALVGRAGIFVPSLVATERFFAFTP